MPTVLPPHEHALLTVLGSADGELGFEKIVEAAGIDQSLVSAAAAGLKERGWVTIEEESVTEPVLTEAGREAAEHGVPERRLLLLLDLDKTVPMNEVHRIGQEKGFDGAAAVQWVFRKGWAQKRKGEGDAPDAIEVTHAGEEALLGPSPDEVALGRALRGEITWLEDLAKDGIDVPQLVSTLRSRKNSTLR